MRGVLPVRWLMSWLLLRLGQYRPYNMFRLDGFVLGLAKRLKVCWLRMRGFCKLKGSVEAVQAIEWRGFTNSNKDKSGRIRPEGKEEVMSFMRVRVRRWDEMELRLLMGRARVMSRWICRMSLILSML